MRRPASHHSCDLLGRQHRVGPFHAEDEAERHGRRILVRNSPLRRIAATISSSVKSGRSATKASSHFACFSNGDVLPSARLCFGASGVTPALQPFHRGTRTQIEALSGLPPRRSRFDCLDHAFPQIIGIRLRHRVEPKSGLPPALRYRHVLREIPDTSTQPGHALAAIMRHASLFCAPGSRTRAGDPSVWIGVCQLAVQRVWG